VEKQPTGRGPEGCVGVFPRCSLDPYQLEPRKGNEPKDEWARESDKGTLAVMPWPIYRNMTDRDLDAIYAYLSAIPHAEPGNCFAHATR
jgi:hypothetical protein